MKWFILAVAMVVLPGNGTAAEFIDWRWRSWDQPCEGDCAFTIFAGRHVIDSMMDLFVTDPRGPWDYEYGPGGMVGVAFSRQAATLFGRISVDPEIGIAKRFGNMDEMEFWGAIYLRYSDFPWSERLRTSVGLSTGINIATGVSEFERNRAKDDIGARVMHYFAPEITFGLPEYPDIDLVFRFHHRSGAFGLFNRVGGGAHYATVGVRFHF
jgi:hypothetical protein